MSKERLSPEMTTNIQIASAWMGLTLAFKKRYGEEALKVTEAFGEQMGRTVGNMIKEKAGIVGSNIRDIERLINAWMDPSVAWPPHFSVSTKVEGKKLTVTREKPTQCPALHVSKTLSIPVETICNFFAFPIFRGALKTINPNVKHYNIKTSEERCVDVIEIP